jgi:GT2 family glycosyltransferase
MRGQPYSVIIVDFDAAVDVKRLRRELHEQGNPQVIVVDAKAEKLGYGAALNRGMELAEFDFVICMNPDISLKKNALPLLIEKLQNESSIGMVGPQILDRYGRTQITCSKIPTAWQALVLWSWLKKIFQKKIEHWYRLQSFDHHSTRVVPSVSGACFAVRKKDWIAIGGADEKLFLYFEEFYLAQRLALRGFPVLFCAESVVTHFGQVSTNTVQNISKIFIQSRKYWLSKHYGISGQICAKWLEFWEQHI